MSQISDAILDAAAIASAVADGDTEAADILLAFGDPEAIARVLAGWVGGALNLMPAGQAAAMVSGWRAMGLDRADPADPSGWADYG
jgi:hypothetical protein